MTNTITEWTIKEIEAMTENDAQEMAIESMVIKDHNIYFVDFGGYFGYSGWNYYAYGAAYRWPF